MTKIPFAGVNTVVVTSAHKVIKTPLPGGGKPNPACGDFKERRDPPTYPENPQSSPGLEDIWQLHWSWSAGMEYNAPGVFIANVDDPAVVAAALTNIRGGRPGRGKRTRQPNAANRNVQQRAGDTTGGYTAGNTAGASPRTRRWTRQGRTYGRSFLD